MPQNIARPAKSTNHTRPGCIAGFALADTESVGNRAVGTGKFPGFDEVVRPALRIGLPIAVHGEDGLRLPVFVDGSANGPIRHWQVSTPQKAATQSATS